MPDVTELMNTIKRVAVAAVKAEKLVETRFGKVTGTKPLSIRIDQKTELGPAQLVLGHNVTDHEVEITVNWDTEEKEGGSMYDAFAAHAHAIKGRKKITVHNGLVVGDEVILVREQGGQKYIVVDRKG